MKLTITMDLTQENLKKLKMLIPENCVSVDIVKKEVENQPAKENVQTAHLEETAEESITKTDIRAVALKLSKSGKQKELAAAFAKFGCKKLSDFDSRTEDYPALMKELVSANG